jgi:hypothetical protein
VTDFPATGVYLLRSNSTVRTIVALTYVVALSGLAALLTTRARGSSTTVLHVNSSPPKLRSVKKEELLSLIKHRLSSANENDTATSTGETATATALATSTTTVIATATASISLFNFIDLT